MRAAGIEQSEPALGVAEGDEELTERLDAQRLRVGLLDLVAEQDGEPEATDERAHGCLGPHAGQQIVVLRRKHALILVAECQRRKGTALDPQGHSP